MDCRKHCVVHNLDFTEACPECEAYVPMFEPFVDTALSVHERVPTSKAADEAVSQFISDLGDSIKLMKLTDSKRELVKAGIRFALQHAVMQRMRRVKPVPDKADETITVRLNIIETMTRCS